MMENDDELFLLQKLKEGDIRALETIFNRHYSNLCRYLLLLFKNELLVEHIAQDIFVYIWENHESLDIKNIKSYLYTAGKYKALNEIRNARRREAIRLKLAVEQKETSVDKIIEIKELEQIIEDAICTLPDRCQQIFRLSRENELSYKEIASFLNISLNTVEGQMAIALKKMRLALKPFYIYILFL
jgi:RNA polymerase sigma-70 factor (ECF subfamily)